MGTAAVSGHVPEQAERWTDWRWQQRAAVRTAAELRELFPELPAEDLHAVEQHSARMRFQVTRHYLSLVERTPGGGAPVPGSPLWRQVVPASPDAATASAYRYDGTENWERPEEMVTPIAQRKYDDRVIVRAANVCHSYCQFCYEALRTLERESDKPAFNLRHWDATLAYLNEHPEVHEVILSGGEPLMQSDAQLSRILGDLRALRHPVVIRFHTRALSFNPFRITDELCSLFEQHEVTAVGLHVTHVDEIGDAYEEALRRLRRVVPVLFANIPLLRGVNDTSDDVRALGTRLYRLGVARGYLYHFMPHSPGADRYRTPVRAGVDITRELKRRVSNLAVPEFVLPHETGKHSPPLLAPDEQPMRWVVREDGDAVVRYVNWQGEQIDYPDPPVIG